MARRMTSVANIDKGTAAATCWSCKGQVAPGAALCGGCGAVQPPGQVDHFTRFRFARAFDIDPAALDRRYFEAQRALHPDRFATCTAPERALSMQHSTTVNEAYETLKSPLARAEYLLSLHGLAVNAETGGSAADPEVLGEAMAAREALAEAASENEVERLAAEGAARRDACLDALALAFAHRDLARAAVLTTRLKFLDKFADEARRRCAAPRCAR
jgi:molecular chaperone HscB